MVDFICDDENVEDALRRLHKLVVENGGEIYDGLKIVCQNGDLSVSCDENKPEGKRIILLPKSCLLPISAFTLVLKDGKIVMEGYDKDRVSPAQADMMGAYADLLNATNKVAWYKGVAPQGLYYKDRALFNMIFEPFIESGMPLDVTLAAQTEDEFALRGLIDSRVIAFKNYFDLPEAEGVPVPFDKVVMPFAELLNHHPRARGFFTDFKCGGESEVAPEVEDEAPSRYEGVVVVKSCPAEGSDECFISYGPKDALVSFLYYSYVETGAMWLTSIPMKIDIPDVGELTLLGQSRGEPPKDLPGKMKDLKFYMPPGWVNRQEKQARLSFLFISQSNAPRAMRRVLAYFLTQSGMVSTDEELQRAVLFAERAVIKNNWHYYEALSEHLDRAGIVPGTEMVVANIRELVNVQRAKLQQYPFFADAGGAELVGAKHEAVGF